MLESIGPVQRRALRGTNELFHRLPHVVPISSRYGIKHNNNQISGQRTATCFPGRLLLYQSSVVKPTKYLLFIFPPAGQQGATSGSVLYSSYNIIR